VRFRAVVTDDSGRTAEASTVTTLTANQPPTLSITSSYSPVIAGYPEHFCVDGYDDAQVASVELDLDGAVFTTVTNYSSGTTDYKQVCADYVVPQEASVAAAAVVRDSFGLGASTTKSIPVVANIPPWITIERTDYLVAGVQGYFTATFNDERATLTTVDFTANGASLLHRVNTYSSNYATNYYTPSVAGTLHIVASAQDRAGAIGQTAADIPVLAAGSGLSCTAPVQLPPTGTLRIVQGTLAQSFPNGCGQSTAITQGTWLALPFDGPVISATIATSGTQTYVVAQDGCPAATLPGTCAYTAVTGPLSRDARLFVVYANAGGNPTYLGIVRATLGVGALCDPSSTTITCATNRCWDNGVGEFRCAATACSDGVDNDGNGKIDYPADPGCSSYADDDESPPASPPTCSDGIDNDLNGLTDYPNDVSCPSASASTEGFCRGSSVAADLTGMALPLTMTGTTVGGAPFNDAWDSFGVSPGRVYRWVAPQAGHYRIDLQSWGFTAEFNVWKNPACPGNPSIYGSTFMEFDAAAGEVVAIVAHGYYGSLYDPYGWAIAGPYMFTLTRVR